MNTIKLNSQLLLVKFPIIFPIIYGIILFQFPQFETELIILTILLLAETHFGATWPFLIDKVNFPLIKEKRVSLVAIPLFIIVLCLLGFFFINKLFLLIFFAANVFHVTRQSFGVCKLYCKDSSEKKFQEIFIYIFNLIFFIIGYLRFYVSIINESNIFFINIFIISLLLLINIIYLIRFGISENFLTFITGCVIFYPICFVDNPVHAIIMGVTMHYTQYIYLTYNVCKFRNEDREAKDNLFFSKKIYNYFVVIAIYSILMSILSLFGKNEDSMLKNLIIIPILGQMLHFYLDGQLWKFSEKHHRDHTLTHLNKLL